jgi:hypothetical protein
MSNVELVAALRLLMAARELLADSLASDAERKRIADQIGRFINHAPVDPEADPMCGRCGQKLSLHDQMGNPLPVDDGECGSPTHGDPPSGSACPKGGGTFTHAEQRVKQRRGWLADEADDE